MLGHGSVAYAPLMPPDPAAHGAGPTTRTGVVVPIRSFAGGHARLAGVLDEAGRAALGRDLATGVLAAAAAAPFPVVVVTSAAEVRAWAPAAGATDVIDDPGSLDAAARAGVDWCRGHGLARAVVAHADLPWARDFGPVVRDAARPVVTLVPCHRDDGTPVLSVPVDVDFTFSYGAGSFRRHVAAAHRAGCGVRVVRDVGLAFDVDEPDDLVRTGLLTVAT